MLSEKKRQCERKQRNKKGTMKRNLLNKVLCISHKVGISFFFYHSKIDAIYQIPHCVCEFVMRIAFERYAYEKEKRQYCSYSGHFFLTQTISICELKVVSQRENLNIAQIMMCPLSATCDTFRCFDWFGYIARIIAYQQQISKWANNWNQSGSKKIHAKMPHKYAIHIQWICIAKCALCSRVSQAKPSTTKPSQSQFEREFQVIIEKQSECCTHRHIAKSICMGKMVCNYLRHISSWNNVSIE